MTNRMRDANAKRLSRLVQARPGESLGNLATLVDRILSLEGRRATASWSATAVRRRGSFLSDLVPGAADVPIVIATRKTDAAVSADVPPQPSAPRKGQPPDVSRIVARDVGHSLLQRGGGVTFPARASQPPA